MFWDKFVELCAERGTKPNRVAKELGFSSGSVTSWKKGAIPQNTTLKKIADYFGVSVQYLLGITSINMPSTDAVTAQEAFAAAAEKIKKASDEIGKEKDLYVEVIDRMLRSMSNSELAEVKRYAEYLISRNENN